MNHLLCFLLILPLASVVSAETVNPFPRAVLRTEERVRWDFKAGVDGWEAVHDCEADAKEGVLSIQSTGDDPYLHGPGMKVVGPAIVKLRIRGQGAGNGAIYFATDKSKNWGEDKVNHFTLEHDGEWHDIEVPLRAHDTVIRLRVDPGSGPGRIDVDSIAVATVHKHPFEIVEVKTEGRRVTAVVRNHASKSDSTTTLTAKGTAPFEAVSVSVEEKGMPAISRPVFLHHADVETEWLTLAQGGWVLQAAPDGSGARLSLKGKVVAIICPLVHRDGRIPALRPVRQKGGLQWVGEGITVQVTGAEEGPVFHIASQTACEGPVVRALGGLEQGILAGVEHLGKGERSSSKLDIESAGYLRYAPDVMKMTLPFMACVTDKVSVAVTWDDMTLQPVYASPNFFDGTPDHRMALRGATIDCAVRLAPTEPVEEAILWVVKRRGLPDPPKPPRTRKEQWALCLTSLNGPVKGPGGWGHCAEERWKRHPFAAFPGVIWRMTGDAPKLDKLQGGGAHIRNDTIWFVQSRVQEWLDMRRGEARALAKRQKPDGSYRYKGKYQKGHFEDTASGYCAGPAANLLEFAWRTGDAEALKAGVKTLDYMTRFRTPRGAQVWELSLHTPDVLASAHLVHAYVRGYQLTGEKGYLAEARRWALSGVPFVTQWTCRPVMLYAATPVLGATNWQAPDWIGLPVQWCGINYAYALHLLAPHDRTLDWKRLAWGILISGEQQQYPDGKFVGTLPDSFELRSQQRRPWNINPTALVCLRLALEGEVDSTALAIGGGHRVLAPFPVAIEGGKARIQARKGLTYQILVDGKKIVDITSKGEDVLELD